jgi:hypothetical protein
MLYGFAKKSNTAYGLVRPIDLKVLITSHSTLANFICWYSSQFGE